MYAIESHKSILFLSCAYCYVRLLDISVHVIYDSFLLIRISNLYILYNSFLNHLIITYDSSVFLFSIKLLYLFPHVEGLV